MARRIKGSRLIGPEKQIYDVIKKEKRIKPLNIAEKTSLSPRSVRHALKKLEERDIISKMPDLSDLRSSYYFISDVN